MKDQFQYFEDEVNKLGDTMQEKEEPSVPVGEPVEETIKEISPPVPARERNTTQTFEIQLDNCPLDCSLVFKNLPRNMSAETWKTVMDISNKIIRTGERTGSTVSAIRSAPTTQTTPKKRKARSDTKLTRENIEKYNDLAGGLPPAERVEIFRDMGWNCKDKEALSSREWYLKQKAKKEDWNIQFKF